MVCAPGAGVLREGLCGLHDGRPLVVIGLHSAQEVAKLSETCNALLDVLFPVGGDGETATGNLLITDPAGVLCEAEKRPEEKTRRHDRPPARPGRRPVALGGLPQVARAAPARDQRDSPLPARHPDLRAARTRPGCRCQCRIDR
ncbi:MAG: hypothetical protein ACR2RV_11485 [Verrucomicrobiales bacterium]